MQLYSASHVQNVNTLSFHPPPPQEHLVVSGQDLVPALWAVLHAHMAADPTYKVGPGGPGRPVCLGLGFDQALAERKEKALA
jgi:hypothetical protein